MIISSPMYHPTMAARTFLLLTRAVIVAPMWAPLARVAPEPTVEARLVYPC
jgi:alpha-beta hydrolase superfamily lysophospholipase